MSATLRVNCICYSVLRIKTVNKPTRIHFITTFNPTLPHVSNIIRDIRRHLLLTSNCRKIVFQHPHVVVLRRSSINLRVSVKLLANRTNPNLSLPSDFSRCGKKSSLLAIAFPTVLLIKHFFHRRKKFHQLLSHL